VVLLQDIGFVYLIIIVLVGKPNPAVAQVVG
jgi:hypothetical protein